MNNVVAFHNGKTVEPIDKTFFTKDQVRVGTKLCYFGRTNPGATFVVTYIRSYRRSGKGNYYAIRAEVASRFDDIITVVSANTRDRRTFTFAYLSYSAIWRIV